VKQQELLVVAELPPVLVVVAGSSTAKRAGRELHGHGPTAESRRAASSREGSRVVRGVQGGEVERHGAESEEELPRLVPTTSTRRRPLLCSDLEGSRKPASLLRLLPMPTTRRVQPPGGRGGREGAHWVGGWIGEQTQEGSGAPRWPPAAVPSPAAGGALEKLHTNVRKTGTLWWIRRELPAATPPRSWGRTPPRLAPPHRRDDGLLCAALCLTENELEEGQLPGEGGAPRRRPAPRRCRLVKPPASDPPKLLVELRRAGGTGQGGTRRPRGSCTTPRRGPLVRCHPPSRGPCSAARLAGVSREAEGAGTLGERWGHTGWVEKRMERGGG
jgi:hypothetical protein